MAEINFTYVDVTPLSEPDLNWVYVDKAGHEHRWQGTQLPTLEEIEDSPECGEYPGVSHHECKQCREVIYPAWRTPMTRRYVRVEC